MKKNKSQKSRGTVPLKVVTNEKEGGREAGKCLKMVPDRGGRCLFSLQSSPRLIFKVFPFPVCKAQLIGN